MLEDLDKILDTILNQSQALAGRPDATLLPRVIEIPPTLSLDRDEASSGVTESQGELQDLSASLSETSDRTQAEEINVPTVEPFNKSVNFSEEIPEGTIPAPQFFSVPETPAVGVSSPATDLPGPRSGMELDASGSDIPVPDGVPAVRADLPGSNTGEEDAPELFIPAAATRQPQEIIEAPEQGSGNGLSPELEIPAPEGIKAAREDLPRPTEIDSVGRIDIPSSQPSQKLPDIPVPEITDQREPEFGNWVQAASSGIADRIESRISDGFADLYGRVSHYVEDRLSEEMLKLDRRFTR